MSPLKRRRLALSLSQREVARKVGVTPVAWGNWEAGKRQPKAVMYGRIAKALNTSPEAVIDDVVETRRIRDAQAKRRRKGK